MKCNFYPEILFRAMNVTWESAMSGTAQWWGCIRIFPFFFLCSRAVLLTSRDFSTFHRALVSLHYYKIHFFLPRVPPDILSGRFSCFDAYFMTSITVMDNNFLLNTRSRLCR